MLPTLAELIHRLERKPRGHATANEIAVTYARRGEYKLGIPYLEAALRAAPRRALPEYLSNMALAVGEENPRAAVPLCERAISLAPRSAALCRQLATLHLESLNDPASARDWLVRAIQADPADAPAYGGLCEHLMDGRTGAEAAAACRALLAGVRFDARLLREGVGRALQDWGRYQDAIGWWEALLEDEPGAPTALIGLARSLERVGETDRAVAAYECALASNAAVPDVVAGCVDHLLRTGRWMAARRVIMAWDRRRPRTSAVARPWDGAEVAGRTFLVDADGGYGDMLHFGRYAERLAQLGAREVVVQCQRTVQALLATVPGVSRAILHRDEQVRADFHDSSTMLVAKMPDGPQPWVGSMPYLSPPPLNPQLSSLPGPWPRVNVGLVWSASPIRHADPYTSRSLSFTAFESLLDVPGVKYWSLQVGSARAELTVSPARERVVDLGGQLKSFADTAAVMSALDLIVTVDTSTAHLAGALNRPTQLLLAAHPCWRWPRARIAARGIRH